MEQDLDNNEKVQELETADGRHGDGLHGDSSRCSSMLNLNCDSNLMFESGESSASSTPAESTVDDKLSNKTPLDFANVGELLAGDTEGKDMDFLIGASSKDNSTGDSKESSEGGIKKTGEDSLDSEHGKEEQEQVSHTPYESVHIMTIDVPDDDDLFDFTREPASEKAEIRTEDLENTELYKYLTERDMARLQSLEVTPCPSRPDSGESEESEASDGYTSASSEEETPVKRQVLYSSSSYHGEETPVKSPPPVRRRGPGRKPAMYPKPSKKPAKSEGLSAKTIDKLEKSKQVTDKWISDLAIPENLTFTQKVTLDLLDLNQYLTCGLCKGYLYEASTVTECMHTFCKNCIVRHCMEVSLHCPVCSILIHPTDPFVNIRLDRMIQDIVYKLLPNVAATEMKKIQAFYAEHPEMEPKVVQVAPPPKPKVSPRDKDLKEKTTHSQMVSLLLETEEENLKSIGLEKKYIRVTSRATIANVRTFLRRKLELAEQSEVELYCCGDAVEDITCTLDKIKNKFFGEQDCLMLMQYKVRES